jgi:hypothetical protein
MGLRMPTHAGDPTVPPRDIHSAQLSIPTHQQAPSLLQPLKVRQNFRTSHHQSMATGKLTFYNMCSFFFYFKSSFEKKNF